MPFRSGQVRSVPFLSGHARSVPFRSCQVSAIQVMPGQCHSGHARSVPFSSGHASSVPFSSGHARSVPFSSVKLKLHVFTTFFTCRISMHGRQRCLIELSCALPGCWERLSLHYFHRSITHKPRGLAFTVVQDDFVFGTMGQGQCESAIKLRDDLGVYVLTGV